LRRDDVEYDTEIPDGQRAKPRSPEPIMEEPRIQEWTKKKCPCKECHDTQGQEDGSKALAKQMLNILVEVRSKGKFDVVKPVTGEWEVIEAIVDSGATVPVMPPEVGTAYPIEEGAAAKAGVMYEIANGTEIPNLGERFMAVLTPEGSVKGYSSQIANVSRTLQAVRALCKSGHAVVFDDDGSFLFNKHTGELNWINDDGANYTMKQWVIPPNKLQEVMQNPEGFAWPA